MMCRWNRGATKGAETTEPRAVEHFGRGEKPVALTLDQKRCAVMAMDFQNDILETTPNYREKHLLETVSRVLNTARHAGAAVVYITVSFRDDYADAPAHVPLFQEEKAKGVMKAGSPGAAICDELTPQVGDIVINKHGVDPFHGTRSWSHLPLIG